MFKSFFKKDDDDIFETVDPIVEQRRSEKFSKPLIYDEEFEDQKQKVKETEKKPVEKEVTKEITEPPKTTYEMVDVISPIFGHTENKENKTVVKKKSPKKTKRKENSLVQVISPYYGNFEYQEKDENANDAILTSAKENEEEKKEPQTIEEVPTVEDNLRNIAKIVEEEQNQLKIIEERTGEFKLDFKADDAKKSDTLIDEIDDNMSLDELMSLYEKKFKD